MTEDTHTPSNSQSHPSNQEELAPFHTSDTMTESPLLERDPLLASPANENPNKELLLDNELTAACVALDQDLCAHLSRDEVERSEAQSNDDQSQTDYTTSSPFPRRHHSHLYPPAPPNNTPETNSPALGDVSLEEVYHQVPEPQLSTAQAFAAKGSEKEQQEGTQTVDDAQAVAQEVINAAPMESNAACEGDIPDVDSQGILQKMIFEKFALRFDDQSEAKCTEQIDCTPGQEVPPGNVDEATSNPGEMWNPEETEEDSPSMDYQSRPISDQVVPYTVAENPHATHNEESAEDMATPVDETSNGTQVREKKDDLECDVESLAITDPPVLSQTGVLSDNVPECLPSRELETDALASNSMAHIGTNLHQDSKLVIFESNVAITNEPQSDEGDNAENKSLKRPYEESPMTYPKSVLERKPEVEIKKNLFGETSTAISGEKCASESQLLEDLLSTRMLGQGVDPTEPRKMLKTEHYNEQLGEDTATPVDDTSNGTQVHAKQDDLECDVESLAITDPTVLCQTSVVSDNVPECLPSPEVETDALASNSMACIGTHLHQDSKLAFFESNIAITDEPQSDEGDNAENKSLKRSYGESPMSYPKSVLERKPEVEIKKNLFGKTSTVINGEKSANESQPQEELLNIRMTGQGIDPTEPRKSLKTEHYDAHGREAYIEVSKVDSVSPEEDAEGNPHCLNTDESIQLSVPPLKLEANGAAVVTGHDGPNSGITEIVSLEHAEVLPQLKALTHSATSTTTPTLDADACYVNTADGSSPAQGEEGVATAPMIDSRPVAEDKPDTLAVVSKLLTDPITPKGTEIHLDNQPDQKSVNLDHVSQDEDTNNAAKSEELPLKDIPSNLDDNTSSGAVCDLTPPERLPSKEVLLDSNDIPLSNTVRQRIKRNEVSDTLPLAEAAKSSVDGSEPGSFTLRIMTCGMIGVTVFILLELLFPSQLEYIIAGLMGRTEG